MCVRLCLARARSLRRGAVDAAALVGGTWAGWQREFDVEGGPRPQPPATSSTCASASTGTCSRERLPRQMAPLQSWTRGGSSRPATPASLMMTTERRRENGTCAPRFPGGGRWGISRARDAADDARRSQGLAAQAAAPDRRRGPRRPAVRPDAGKVRRPDPRRRGSSRRC